MKKAIAVFTALLLAFSVFLTPNDAAAKGKFKDVSGSYWANKEIEYLSGKGVISGFKDGSFKPETNVTRAQAAIMLVRALNLSLKDRPNPGFKDVSTKHGAYKHIAAIVDEGIYPKGKNYSPDKALTRQEMARMLVNAYSFKGKKNVTFKDVPTSYWAQPYISILAENGVAAGYSNGTYKPSASVTRAQFSVFLSRAMDPKFRVKPVTSPVKTTPVLMKDIKLGNPVSHVKNRETREFVAELKEGNLSLLVYATTKYGYASYLNYYFENNRLVYVVYDFLPDVNAVHSRSEMAYMHELLHTQAVKEFGTNFYYIEESYPYTTFATLWDKGTYGVGLSVDDENYYTDALMIYHEPMAAAASAEGADQTASLKAAVEALNEKLGN